MAFEIPDIIEDENPYDGPVTPEVIEMRLLQARIPK